MAYDHDVLSSPMPQKVQVAYENEYSNNDQGAFYRASIFHMAVT